MKKIILSIIVAVIFIMAIGKLQQYTIKGTVIENRDNTIIVEDTTGKPWEIEVEAFIYCEGDRVMLTMKDKGTTSRLDDEVINIKPIAE